MLYQSLWVVVVVVPTVMAVVAEGTSTVLMIF
jgi:hypothetical protein